MAALLRAAAWAVQEVAAAKAGMEGEEEQEVQGGRLTEPACIGFGWRVVIPTLILTLKGV